MGRMADTSRYTQAEIDLWTRMTAAQETCFHTAKGLEFHMKITGNELFIDRREKSITRSSVNIAYRKWRENPLCGPKSLGVFGASYLWSIFREVGRELPSDAVPSNTEKQG